MSKFGIDRADLERKLTKKAYKLSDVKDKIQKVAFDVVRFKDGDVASDLWKIENGVDGPYIVAMYSEDDEVEKKSSWEVASLKSQAAFQIYYKGDPIVKIAFDKLKIPTSELNKVPEYLPSKLAENKKLVHSLLKELDDVTKKQVLVKYPELV
jgi:hypothetical protein